MVKVYRMGHQIFRMQDRETSIIRSSIRQGLELHSESGRITPVLGVLSARTRDGGEVMIAPNGAIVDHPEHGRLELPAGVYSVEPVKEARPEEESTRSVHFESPNLASTSLTGEQLD